MVPKMIQGPRMLTSYSLYRAGVSSGASMGPQKVRDLARGSDMGVQMGKYCILLTYKCQFLLCLSPHLPAKPNLRQKETEARLLQDSRLRWEGGRANFRLSGKEGTSEEGRGSKNGAGLIGNDGPSKDLR